MRGSPPSRLNATSPGLRLAVAAVLALVTVPVANAQDIFAGRTIYEDHCASCHGLDGRPTVPGTPDFSEGSSLFVSDAELIRVVKSGKSLMPAYDRVLKESEVLDVISYLRTLRR